MYGEQLMGTETVEGTCKTPARRADIEDRVTDLYGRLWEELGSIVDVPIVEQFLYNVDLPREWFRNKSALDAGCGSGFATAAMESLGAECVACDLGFEGLRRAREKLSPFAFGGYPVNASVLRLPFAADTFDFVHCNGVLHHTLSPQEGFNELVRVAKPGGTVFVGVYGRGGAYNAGLTIGRLLARAVPYRWTERAARLLLGERRLPNSFIPARVSVLDNLYVPIRQAYREREIRGWFHKAGWQQHWVKRTKTTLFDHSKAINRFLYGEGYIQLRGTRPSASGER